VRYRNDGRLTPSHRVDGASQSTLIPCAKGGRHDGSRQSNRERTGGHNHPDAG
jgi:hypothetical protein